MIHTKCISQWVVSLPESHKMSVQTLNWGTREQNRVYRCVHWKQIYYIWVFEIRKFCCFLTVLAESFQKSCVFYISIVIYNEIEKVVWDCETQFISLFWRAINYCLWEPEHWACLKHHLLSIVWVRDRKMRLSQAPFAFGHGRPWA